jgi:TrmH family RNA methyltransferase
LERPVDVYGGEVGDAFVASPRNPRIRDVLRLYKRRERDRRGVLVAEGVWALRTALHAQIDIHEVYFCRDYFHGGELALLSRARAAGARLTELSTKALQRVSLRDGPDGIISVVRKPVGELRDIDPAGTPLVCVAQTIEKPGNLGAIIRTACAASADAVIVCDPMTDAYSPAVVRASLGSLFLLPVIVTTSAAAVAWLRSNGIAIYAATPQGTNDPWCADFVRPSAIVIGNEHRGLSDPWLEIADAQVRIPMPGPMNSLNASTAAGVLLFEAVRQRADQPGMR